MQVDLYNGVKQLCIDQSVDQFNSMAARWLDY